MERNCNCQVCGEFIGSTDDLDVCPICGHQLHPSYTLEDEYGFCYGDE
jgi:rRNA maturation endonuclease Nob1